MELKNGLKVVLRGRYNNLKLANISVRARTSIHYMSTCCHSALTNLLKNTNGSCKRKISPSSHSTQYLRKKGNRMWALPFPKIHDQSEGQKLKHQQQPRVYHTRHVAQRFNDKFNDTFSIFKDSNSTHFYMDGHNQCYMVIYKLRSHHNLM